MRSKLTKTILMIVFVVFLGLIKTEGVSAYYAYCYYTSEDASSKALVYITDGFEKAKGTYKAGSDSSAGVSVKNWAQSGTTRTSYKALDDAWQDDHCPQYLIYVKHTEEIEVSEYLQEAVRPWINDGTFTIEYFYMSDSENLNIYKDVLEENDEIVAILSIDSNTYPNKNSEYGTYIPARICDCENGKSYTIAENGDLSGIKVGDKNVQNWLSTNTFSAIDGIKSNECLILIYNSSGKVYLTDDAHYDEVFESSGGVTSFACEISSQTPIEVEKVKPEYNPASVRDDVVDPLISDSGTVSCGNGYMTDIPTSIVKITRIIYILIQILVPIALVILGSLDLVKAVMAQKEDEIKKGQQTFVKRLIAAIIVFFVFVFIKIIVSIVSNDDTKIIDCMNCFLNGVNNCETESSSIVNLSA